MRLETLDTTMRREQTKAEAVARLMASFASHLQAATTETVRETSKQADSQRLPQRQEAGASPAHSFFADLQPAQDNASAAPKAADPVRPTDTEQHAAAPRSATADVSGSPAASNRIADLRPTASSVPPQPATSSASQSAPELATTSAKPASPATSSAKGDTSAAHPTSGAANSENVAAQNNAPPANAPAAPSAAAHDNGAKAEAGAKAEVGSEAEADAVNTRAPAETAPVKVAGEAKAAETAPVAAEHAAVATKGVKSVTQHASKDDEATDAPATTVAAPAQATDAATRTMVPEAAISASRSAAAATPAPAETPQIAPLSSAAPAPAMGIAPRPRAGTNQPAEAEVAGKATPTPASAGAADASHLDGADATIRPQADGGLLVTLAPSANGPVQMKLDVTGGVVSNLVFIAPYQQTRNTLEALRPAIAAATRSTASMRIQSSSRNAPNATSQGPTETSVDGGDHPHIDVRI